MIPDHIGRYEIKAELGRGGMATVYHAYDPRFKREVALKVLPREFLHDSTFRARFEREAQTVAALEHSAIVPVYDFGEENGQLYLVMRYLPGGSLADRLKQGALSFEEMLRIITPLVAALDEAHKQGIIHRDLKPDNILFDQRDEPYLADFGIAKQSTTPSTLTTGGLIVGTPAYMSPEQANGDELDGRSDLYSLAVIIFEMLTGQTPYEAITPIGQLMKHLTEPVPLIETTNPDLPFGSDAVMSRALAKQREDRYSTAVELAAALNALVSIRTIPALDTRPLEVEPIPPKRVRAITRPSSRPPEPPIICPKCREPNPAKLQTCTSCGYRLHSTCIMCHTLNRIDATHCLNCGADLKRTQLMRHGVDEARRRALAERDEAYREKEAHQLRNKIQELLNHLRSGSKRNEALRQLNQLDKDSLSILTDNLQQDRAPEQRALTAGILGQFCAVSQVSTPLKSQATQALIDTLDDPNPQVRQQAQQALQKIGKKQKGEILAIFRGLLDWFKGG